MTEDSFFDEFNEEPEEEEEALPEESSNRTFLLVAGGLGLLVIVSLICIAVYALVLVPRRRDAQSTQVAEINAQNTQVAYASGLTAEASAWTDTPTPTRIPNTATPSPTPLLAPSNTPAAGQPTEDPRTATVAALLTIQAGGNLTTTPTVTELPDTGFADDVGIPGMLALAAALILVILLARRLRTA
jgi:hypothetical protein